MLVWPRLPLKNVLFETAPEVLSDDGQVADLPAFAEDRQVAAVIVLELNPGELALAEAEPEQQQQRDPIAEAWL